MTGTRTFTSLCSSVALPGGDEVPDWIELLPAGTIQTLDARGPYTVADAKAVITNSFRGHAKLVLDENHATDLAAPHGQSAPARGWIVEMQERQGAIWGRVEWTGQGRQIMADKQYNGISPAIVHGKDKTILAIARASLTNNPNLIGLTSLHAEGLEDMDWKKKLLEALGLDSNVDDAAIEAALAKKLEGGAIDGAVETAVQSALAPIAKLVGAAEGADGTVVLNAVKAKVGTGDERVTALQSELSGLTTTLNTLRDETAKDKATAYVDGEIAKGRVGLKPVRAEYISMHMKDAAGAVKLISAMPVLNSGPSIEPRDPEADPDLTNPTLLAARAGVYQKKMAEAGQKIDFGTAVRAVEEGKDK
jgi:phage I-like protein